MLGGKIDQKITDHTVTSVAFLFNYYFLNNLGSSEMMNVQSKKQESLTKFESVTRTGPAEYWQILSDIMTGKEKVYSHEYVMSELHKILKK
jgi:hypothetical protein